MQPETKPAQSGITVSTQNAMQVTDKLQHAMQNQRQLKYQVFRCGPNARNNRIPFLVPDRSAPR